MPSGDERKEMSPLGKNVQGKERCFASSNDYEELSVTSRYDLLRDTERGASGDTIRTEWVFEDDRSTSHRTTGEYTRWKTRSTSTSIHSGCNCARSFCFRLSSSER